MKIMKEKHNMEGAFVLVLFAMFAVLVVVVLALGARTYKNLVRRDNANYNKRIITSYVSAKIRDNDQLGMVEIGGFASADHPDGVDTLHMYQNIEGEKFDLRVYYYQGKIYEMLTLAGSDMDPEDGSAIMDAKGLSFEQTGKRIHIKAKDADGLENEATVTLRCGKGEVGS